MINIEKIEFFPTHSNNPCNLCAVNVFVNGGINLNFLRLFYVKRRGFLLTIPVREDVMTGERWKYFQFSSEADFEQVRLAVVKRYLHCRKLKKWRLAKGDADICADDISFFSNASDFEINEPDEHERQRNSITTTTTP